MDRIEDGAKNGAERAGETSLQEKTSAALARIEAQLEEIISGRRNTEPEPHRLSSPQSLLPNFPTSAYAYESRSVSIKQ